MYICMLYAVLVTVRQKIKYGTPNLPKLPICDIYSNGLNLHLNGSNLHSNGSNLHLNGLNLRSNGLNLYSSFIMV